jgi:hypothetical protein
MKANLQKGKPLVTGYISTHNAVQVIDKRNFLH